MLSGDALVLRHGDASLSTHDAHAPHQVDCSHLHAVSEYGVSSLCYGTQDKRVSSQMLSYDSNITDNHHVNFHRKE